MNQNGGNRTRVVISIVVALGGCSTASGDQRGESERDAGSLDSAELRAADIFWNEVAICGTPTEEYTDILQAAEAADAVVLGRIAAVTLGNTVKTGTDEDYYAEANVTVDVTEMLRKSSDERPVVSLVLAQPSAETVDAVIGAMQDHLPQEPLVFLLRERTDRDGERLYRPGGAFMGVWARTTRSALDNPLTHERCVDYYGSEIRSTYLKGASTVDELVELLRGD